MIAVSEFTKRELVDAARRARGEDPRRAERGRGRLHARRARAPRATTCSRSARSSRARTSRGSPQAVDGELRVVGARGWGGVEPPANVTWLGDVSDEELARALPRRALPRLRLALRGLRHPGRRGARLRLPGRHEPRLADGGARRRRRDATSTRSTSSRSATGIARATPRRRRGAVASWADVAARDARRLRGARVIVIDADVLGRKRTGDETYVLEPAARAAARRARPALRRRHAPPRARAGGRRGDRAAGAARRSCAWRGRCRGCCGGCGPSSRTSSTRCRSAVAGRRVVTLHDLHFERDPTVMGLARPARPSRRSCRARRAAPTTCSPSRSARSATRSRSTASPPEKVTVTPHGVDPAFAPGDGAQRRLPALRRRGPGAQGPARRARGRARPSGLPLVVAGPEKEPALARELRDGGADVRGYVDKPELARALPRRRRARPAVALRGLRPAGARGDGERDAGRRRRRAGAARGRRRRGGLRRGRRLRRRRPRARSPSASGSSRPGSSARGSSRGRRRRG